MHFITRAQQSQADEGKTRFVQLMHEVGITQEEMAFYTGVDQSTVSRWCNPQNESYPPIYAITNCAKTIDEKANRFAEAFLDWLEDMAGRDAHTRSLRGWLPDGSLDDEFREIAKWEGKFAEILGKDIEGAEKIARKFQEISQRMLAEIKAVRERKAQ